MKPALRCVTWNLIVINSFLCGRRRKNNKQNSQYIQKCAPQTHGIFKIWYFYCNRAGKYIPHGRDIRHIKSQGTSKIGAHCMAHIKARMNEDTGHVTVTYCGSHTHPIKLAHIRIPQQTRKEIAGKLQKGVSMERILDDIRDSVINQPGRKHLVTRQDLHNIKSQYNMDGIMRHKNDLISVMSWVQEMSSLDYNPVLDFQPQGVGSCTDDFLIVIQTLFQRDLLKLFGSNAVCIDSTHGTTAYDFNLTSILIIDEYGEGVPVGWMIANREDKQTLVTFCRAIQKRTGNVNPQWFMTDDAEQYYNAWKEVFNEGSTKKILCTWHVDRAWRKAINQHISDKLKQIEVYHQLRLLLTETKESQFRVMLQEFLTYTEKYHQTFHDYFSGHYCKRINQWASCYRVNTAVNTKLICMSRLFTEF